MKVDYYPFGLEHKGYNNVVNGTEHPYTYNGKEKQEELGLNWMDYGARNYDASLGRWMNIDNLAEQYKTFSPYHYAGNNPISNYDIDGNEFTESAWKWINKLIADINDRQKRNNDKIAEKQALLDKGGLRKGQIRRYNRQIKSRQQNNTELENVRGEIATLEASDQVYNVSETSKNSEDGPVQGMGTTVSVTSFNFSTGAIDIGFDRSGGISQFAHELKHAYQFETGEISFGPKRTGFNFGIDVQDELAGYQRGALFGGRSVEYSRDLGERYNLPEGPYNYNSVKWIRQALKYQNAEKQQKYLMRVATSFRHAFRVNGKTYYKKKK